MVGRIYEVEIVAMGVELIGNISLIGSFSIKIVKIAVFGIIGSTLMIIIFRIEIVSIYNTMGVSRMIGAYFRNFRICIMIVFGYKYLKHRYTK